MRTRLFQDGTHFVTQARMLKLICPLFLFLFGAISVQAQSATVINGVDVAPVVKELQPLLVQPKTAFLMFHWFQAPAQSVWSEPLKSDEPAGFDFVRQASQKFWQSYGTPASDFYGLGLYVASDPIFTHEYGGKNWVLVQIEIPKDFRALDLTLKSATAPLKPSLQEVFKKLDCQIPSSLADLLKGGSLRTSKNTDSCNEAIEKMVRTILQVDGFFYAYGSAGFAACPGTFRNKAMVVTEDKWLKPSLVKVFNDRTRDSLEERAFLQSLFLKTSEHVTETLDLTAHAKYKRKYIESLVLPSYPGYEITAIRIDCGKFGKCPQEVYLCKIGKPRDPQNCPVIPLPILPIQAYPETFSDQRSILVNQSNLQGLLWKDLEGKPTIESIDQQIKTRLLCEEGQL